MIALAAMLLQAPPVVPDDVHNAQRAWVDCITAATTRFAASQEPAETIVSAAYGACASEEHEMNTRLAAWIGAQENADRSIAKARVTFHDRLIALVLNARMAKPAH